MASGGRGRGRPSISLYFVYFLLSAVHIGSEEKYRPAVTRSACATTSLWSLASPAVSGLQLRSRCIPIAHQQAESTSLVRVSLQLVQIGCAPAAEAHTVGRHSFLARQSQNFQSGPQQSGRAKMFLHRSTGSTL